MLELTGYAVGELLHEGPRSLVHRARRLRDGAAVVIKTLREEPPSDHDVAGLERAFELARDLPGGAVIRHLDLVRHRSGVALITEDAGGVSLDRLLPPGGLPLTTFLDVAIDLAHALAELHANGIVHRDLKPQNVVARPDWSSLRIVDLGLASRLDRDLATTAAAGGRIEGTLAYVSPEQTGRMNRPVDQRSDLYSLGVTLYVLATGRLPFAGADPMEIVHAHLARRPRPPHEYAPAIPPAVSEIVLKLLAKSADDRYASARGVARDLEQCRELLRRTGGIERFELARHDVGAKLLIPERLYGREREIDALMASFERAAAGGRELVVVSGFSGIGKSVLVHEIQRPVAIRTGFFCAGKFDQFRRDLPYLALIDALRDLVRRVLTEPDDRIAERRRALDSALGANAAVITQVVPELEVVLGGPPPPVAEVGPSEALHRFRRAFSVFVRVFARAEHPLVLFLDDVQWADAASIALLESLASDRDTQHLMIVLGHRDERDDPRAGQALATALARLEEAGQPVLRLALAPLDEATVSALIADAMRRAPDERASLAPLVQLVHQRTRGNPFFTRELLRALHRGGAITLDREQWTWDPARAAASAITDDVVALMTHRIRELAPDAARVLQIAACIGATFDLATLALVTERTRGEVAGALDLALAEGLVAPVDGAHRLLGALSSIARRRGEEDTGANARYRFLHDRVQQAAHALMPEGERRALHLAIARHLIAATPETQLGEIVIDIVDHLGESLDAVRDPAERLAMARLHLLAGERAASSMAIEPASRYLDAGIALLPRDGWARHHELALALWTRSADMLYRLADDARAGERAAAVLEHARTDLERVPIWRMQVRAGLERNAYREAVDVALHALGRLGLALPRNPTKLDLLAAAAQVFVALGRRSPMALRALPRMRDPVRIATLDLLQETATTSYFDQPNLFVLCAIHAARLSISHGNTKLSAFGYALFGVILCGALERFELGHDFGKLAEAVLEDTGARELEGQVLLATRNFIRPWKEPLAGLHPLLRQSYAPVLDSGDVTYAVYNGTAGFYSGFFAGAQLDGLVDGNADLIRAMRASGQHQAMPMLECWLQAAEQLRDEQRHEPVLRGPIYDHDAMHPVLERTRNRNGIGHASAAAGMMAYLFGDLDRAHRWLEVAADHVEHVLSQPVVPVIRFYRGLTALALARRTNSRFERARHLVIATVETRRLRGWAAHSPINFEHKVVLLEAERARTDHRDGDAVVLYQRAVALARAHGFVQEEALAAERMAEHASERGMGDLAAYAVASAHTLWRRWGARGKAAELASRRRLAVGPIAASSSASAPRAASSTAPLFESNVTSTVTARADDALDLGTVMKAVRLISREIELPRLLERTLELTLENAGADRGALVLAREGGLVVEAEGSVDLEGTHATITSTALRAHPRLPVSLLEYAFRTSETVVVADGPNDRLFARDPHVEREAPRSMMAVPLLIQGKRVGVIYVENRLATGAFTAARRSVLETIGGQAAIALENAKLYEDLCQSLEKQVELAIAHARFVPHQFLSTLRRENILEVRLGDHAQKEMSILFSDIRGFTSIVEKLSVAEALSFINEYLAHMEPAIREHGGFIDTLLGDGIMALYDGTADNAVRGGIAMFRGLERYNEERVARGQAAVRMGIGVSTGMVMLGTIGGGSQMKCGVIGDSVNLAARLEGLTKVYGAAFLISDGTRDRLVEPSAFHIRPVERVRVVGRAEPVTLHEVLDAEPERERLAKLAYLSEYLEALDAYYARDFGAASRLFARCLEQNPADVAVSLFVSRAHRHLGDGVSEAWDGVETLKEK